MAAECARRLERGLGTVVEVPAPVAGDRGRGRSVARSSSGGAAVVSPVVQLSLEDLAGHPVALPEGVVGVLDRKFWEGGRVAASEAS